MTAGNCYFVVSLLQPKNKMNPTDELSNPETTAERLRRLGSNDALRFEILLHPNCPEDFLEAHLFVKTYSSLQWRVAESPKTPPALLARLAAGESSLIRSKLAKNPSTPAASLVELARRDWYLASLVAQNINAPVALLVELSTHEFIDVRKAVAHSTSIKEKALLKMLKAEKEPAVSHEIVQNPSLSPKSLYEISRRNRTYHESIVKNPSASPETLRHIASQDPSEEVLAAIARHPQISSRLLEELSQSSSVLLRKNAAKNPTAPPALQERLARDPDFEVRWGLAENPKLSQPLIETLAQDKHWGVRWMIAQHRGTTATLLSQMLTDAALEVRQAAETNLKENHPD
jgi:hypothetical protein